MTEAHDLWMQTLWAKTGKDNATHLLPYHLIDVAEVAHLLWENTLGAKTCVLVSQVLGLPEEQAGRFLVFLVSLHDLGKASPSFQRKYEPVVPRLQEQGLPFGLGIGDIAHGIVSAAALAYRGDGLLINSGLAPKRIAVALARAIGGHHGVWPSNTDMKRADETFFQPAWVEAREALFVALRDLYQPPSLPDGISSTTESFNAFLMLVSGFTTVADWIGSMSEYFPLQQSWMPLEAYQQIAHKQAEQALRETGWLKESQKAQTLAFEDLLPKSETEPNPVQQAVLAGTTKLEGQTLILLEAPTGIGKTESAFYLSSELLDRGKLQGLYAAMPTQATSNQMHRRMERFLQARYQGQALQPRLLHSQAMWQLAEKQATPSGIFDTEATNHVGGTSTWFLPKKRGLLEPFAVGTVDQALLSVLWTRHFFVRLFGLRHKVLIFDEVHAYDTFMSELFMTLLAWMRWLGSSVIILSATLPNASRRMLVERFGGTVAELDATDTCNARLTLVSADGQTRAASLDAATQQRTIQVEWITAEALTTALEASSSAGGCIAVICNTVRHAQETYQDLQNAQASGLLAGCDLYLFHARYPAAWRQDIEKGVIERFGMEGPRPLRAILVATQVIEQSLDLDFDLLITELPPIDLLIQRIGRLHRHQRETRPALLTEPRVVIFEPAMQDDSPAFGDSEFVYARFLLMASWATLQNRPDLLLPDQSRELIETVYGEGWQALPWGDALAQAHQELLTREDQDQYKAALKHIPLPDAEKLLDGHNTGLDEDDPTVHQAFQALTRDSEPSVQVICLHRVGSTLSLEPDGSRPVDLLAKPDPRLALRYVVSVGHKAVFGALCDREEFALPNGWEKEAALKYHRLAVFEGDLCRVAGTRFVMRLSREYGLEVLKEDEL